MKRAAGRVLGGLLLLTLVERVPGYAISVYKGIQPGKSTREEVVAAFGPPVGPAGKNTFEYPMPSDQGKLLVEFRDSAAVVDRIERVFAHPVSRAAARRALNLPEQPEEREATRDGRVIEYFGGLKVLSLSYAGADTTSGVERLTYYSFEAYDRMLNRARNILVQYDPAACRELYFWSQREREAAKRAKNTARHQAVLEIGIVSQRGDCAKAQHLLAGYQKLYR